MKKIIRLGSLLLLVALAAFADDEELGTTFNEDLARVDNALRTNPSGVLIQSLKSCQKQRNFAVTLYRSGMWAQAQRSLKYCFATLRIPETAPEEKVAVVSEQELRARANREYERALSLTPDIANGLKIYRECAACHEPEGWGLSTGSVPQIAGQHRNVVIRQLADFRAGNRDSVLMVPYATVESIGGTQALADVSAYISTLEMNVDNGLGPGVGLELGARLYAEKCASCHGAQGEGSNDGLVPRIQAQHYQYLKRQFEWIRDGKRRNGNAEMAALARELEPHELQAVLDYSARLKPPEELRAPPDWKNPDFIQAE
jgi:cytochrome c553